MAHFIKDNSALQPAKSNFRTNPNVPADQKTTASDWNEFRQALIDIQSYIRTGLWIDVKTRGAVGDGVTDDRAAIQTAINELGTNGGVVFFPPGNYRVVPSGGTGLTVASPNVHFLGAGKDASKITASANCANGLVRLMGGAQVAGTPYTHAAPAGTAYGFSACGIGFVGACVLADLLPYDSGTYAVGGCIMADSGASTNDVSDVVVEHCSFEGFDQCIASWFSSNLPTAYRWIVRHNKFTGLSPSDFTLSSPRLHVPVRLCGQDCLVEGNTMEGFAYGVNVYPCGQTLPIPGRNRLLANDIILAAAHDVGIYVSSPNETIVAHNNITAPAGRLCYYNGGLLGDGGIKVSANGNQVGMGGVAIFGNTVRGAQIKLSAMQNARVHDNTIIDSPTYGIMLDAAVTGATPSPFGYQLSIQGNTIIRPSGSAIAAAATTIRCRQLLVTGNTIVNPGAFGFKLDNVQGAVVHGNHFRYTDYTQPTGTLAMTSGSGSVVGTGTSFVALDVGRKLFIDGTEYTIATWTDATHITVTPVAVRTNAVAGWAWKNAGPEGTVAVTNGSAAFTGSGTSFLASDVGKTMVVDGQLYIVATVTSATAGTFTTNVSTATNPAATYTWNLGTVSITSGSPTVTGTSTSFSPSDAGRTITINGTTYTIRVVNSPTSLTLTANASSTFSGAWTWGRSQTIVLNGCESVEVSHNKLDFTVNTTDSQTGVIATGGCKDIQVKDNSIVGFGIGVRFQASTVDSCISGNFIRGRSVNSTDNPIFLDNSPATMLGIVVNDNDCFGYSPSAASNVATWRGNVFGASRAPSALAFMGPTAPTIAAGTGAGTGPTLAIVGSDHEGKITLTTGTAPAVSADICTVTLQVTLPTAPYVVLTPANAAAAALTGGAAVYISFANSATFRLGVGSSGLAASTQYVWHYRL